MWQQSNISIILLPVKEQVQKIWKWSAIFFLPHCLQHSFCPWESFCIIHILEIQNIVLYWSNRALALFGFPIYYANLPQVFRVDFASHFFFYMGSRVVFNVSTTVGWIALKFATHVHVPPKMRWSLNLSSSSIIRYHGSKLFVLLEFCIVSYYHDIRYLLALILYAAISMLTRFGSLTSACFIRHRKAIKTQTSQWYLQPVI